jgi:hypothetical protein
MESLFQYARDWRRWFALCTPHDRWRVAKLYEGLLAATEHWDVKSVELAVECPECGEMLLAIAYLLQWSFVALDPIKFRNLAFAFLRRTLARVAPSSAGDTSKTTTALVVAGQRREYTNGSDAFAGDFRSALTQEQWTSPGHVTKHCARLKKMVNVSANDMYTERHGSAARDIHRRREPGRDWYHRVAVSLLLRERLMRMDAGRLYAFTHMLLEIAAAYRDLERNTDFLCLVSDAHKALTARCTTQLVEINERGCTCMAKCMGLVGDELDLQELALHAFANTSTIDVCGSCRLSLRTCRRRTWSSTVPEMSTCSECAASVMERVSLVEFETAADGSVRHSHRFYTSCSKMLSTKKPSAGILYGVCAGRRTCKQLVKNTVRCRSDVPYTDIDFWFRCQECRNTGAAAKDESCLGQWMRGELSEAVRICIGCRVAARCRHAQLNLIGRMRAADGTAAFGRASYAFARLVAAFELPFVSCRK